MSTIWTSTITNSSNIVDNDTIGSTGSSSDSTTIINAFDGIMNDNESLFFGTQQDFSIKQNSVSGSLDFDFLRTTDTANSSVLFNFADSSDSSLLKLYKGGSVAIKNLSSDPTESDSALYDDGSLIIVNGQLKILDKT